MEAREKRSIFFQGQGSINYLQIRNFDFSLHVQNMFTIIFNQKKKSNNTEDTQILKSISLKVILSIILKRARGHFKRN